MFGAYIFDANIIHCQHKLNRMCLVFPEARDKLALDIIMFVYMCLKVFVGEEAGLWQSLHTAGHSDKNHSVLVSHVLEFVFMNDFIWKIREFDADVFRMQQRGHEIKI